MKHRANSKWYLGCLLAVMFLAGCTTQRLLREGHTLMDAGQYEAGLAKLGEVVAAEPNTAQYRVELLTRRDAAVENLLKAAESARNGGQFDEADAALARAQAIGGERGRIDSARETVRRERRHLELLQQARANLKRGDRDAAVVLVRGVLAENPRQRDAQSLQRAIDEDLLKEGMSVPALRSRLVKPVTVQFRDAPIRQVFDALSRSTGINFIFDREVRSDLRATIYASAVPVEDAIDLILLPSQLEKKVLSETSVLVYPNTPAKLREYQDLVIKTFYLANVDAKQTLALIKTMLKTKDVYIDEKLNTLVMRDTPEAVRLAEKLIASQDLADPEVVLEVAVLEISRTRLTELGIKWPDTFGLTVLDPSGAAPLLLSELGSINRSTIAVGPNPSLTINARRSRGDSNLLANPRIRVRNRDKARILVGDRLPVISAIVTPSTGTPITTESVSYVDVGLKLDVEPNVYLDNDVGIKIGLEVSTASNRRTTQNGTTVYDIGTRTASTSLRLRNGETQVLMGLIRDDDRRTASAVPGLGDLPVLGRLFASHLDDAQKTEVVLSITPRIVRNVERADVAVSEFWSGTEAALRAQPLMLRPAQREIGAAATGTTGKANTAEPTAAAAVGESPDVRLSWAGPLGARAGAEVEVELRASLQQPVTSAYLQIAFDAQALEVVGVSEGDLLQADPARTMLNHKIDAGAGKLLVSIVRMGGALEGEGSLLKLTLRPRPGAGPSRVQVTLASPVGTGGRRLTANADATLAVALTESR